MTIVLAYFFCCSLVVIALFGIALYVTAADNRRLRKALAKVAKVAETPVAAVAPRLVEAMGLDSTNYGRN
jgi:ABC-type proline/glycine betaine transport system permease subunit